MQIQHECISDLCVVWSGTLDRSGETFPLVADGIPSALADPRINYVGGTRVIVDGTPDADPTTPWFGDPTKHRPGAHVDPTDRAQRGQRLAIHARVANRAARWS